MERYTKVTNGKRIDKYFYVGAVIPVIIGLYLSSLYSYILFHSLIEITTIAIAFAIFILTWNSRMFLINNYLKILGIGYAFIAFIDLLHTLAYKGMGIFPGFGANLPTQLWISARYLQAATLCAALFFMERRVGISAVFTVYTAAVITLTAMVYSGNFPDCFIDGKGLTFFKIISEYVITAILLISLYFLYRKRKYFSNRVFIFVAFSIICTAISEISFTAYISVYGFANMLGHFSKLAAFYLIYRAILVTGIKDPFDLIFRDLKHSEDLLNNAYDTLEEKVRDRTAELSASEEKYHSLIQNIQAAVVVHGPQTEVIISNSFAQTLLGLSEIEMNGKEVMDPAWNFLREDGTVMPVEEYPVSRVMSTGRLLRDYIVGIKHPTMDTVIWTLVNADPLFSNEGKLLQVFVSFVDITDRKLAEEALIISNERFRKSQAIGHVGSWEYNLQTAMFWGSDEAKRIYGFDPDQSDFSTEEVERCIPERERVHQALIDLIENDKEYNLIFEIHPKNSKETKIITSVAELQRDESGDPLIVTGVIHDITARKFAEVALRESEKRYRQMLESVTDYIYTVQVHEGRPSATVHGIGCEAVTGYSTKDFTADPELWYSMIFEQDRGAVVNQAERLLAGEEVLPIEHRIIHRDGSMRWVRNTCVPRYDHEHKMIAFDGLITDITDRKRFEVELTNKSTELEAANEELTSSNEEFEAINEELIAANIELQKTEETLRISESILKNAQQMAQIGNWEFNISTGRVFASDEFYRIYGLTPIRGNEIDIDKVAACMPDRKRIRQALNDLINHGTPYDFEIEINPANSKTTRVIHSIANRILDGKGAPERAIGVIQDITERKRAEEVLAKTAARLNEAQRIAHIGSWELDIINNVLSWSDEIYRMFEIDPEKFEATYEAFINTIHPEDRKAVDLAYSSSLETKKSYSIDHRLLFHDGRIKYVHEECETIYGENGNPIRSMGVVQDITARKQAEEALNRIEWMLSKKHASINDTQDAANDQGYGDLSALNREGLILKSVGSEVLRSIAADYLDLLGSSSAIYEINGDYAFGIFASNWCRLLDRASRDLCNTKDNSIALNSGQWLCHESCWTRCSKEAIASRAPMDIECSGGIHLYGIPIFANGAVIGAINFGYGDMPKDIVKLQEIADVYHLKIEDVVVESNSYNSRPQYIIDMAKDRLHASARLIGVLVEHKLAEAALIKSEKEFRALTENSPDVIIRYDREGRRIYVNPEFERVNHLTAEQVYGKKPVELSTELSPMVDVFTEKLMKAMESASNTKIDLSWTKNGKLICWFVRVVPELDANGDVVSALTIWSDISERKQAEAALQLSSERLQLATRVAHIGIWDWDVVNNELLWDESMYQLYGIRRDDFGGAYDAWMQAIHPDDKAYIDGEIKAALRGEREYAPEFRIVRTDGACRYIKADSKTIYDRDGKPLRMIGTNIDITEHRLAEEHIRKLNEELEQRVKDRTYELEMKIDEVERLNKVFIGRELRMIELKEKIAELEKTLNDNSVT